MNLIGIDVIEEGSMKLGQHFLIPIVLEAHDVSEAKELTSLGHLVEFKVILFLDLLLVNILYLDNLGLP